MPLQVLTDMNVAKGRLRDWERAELVLLRDLREISWKGRTLKSWLEEAFGGANQKTRPMVCGFLGDKWRGAKGIFHQLSPKSYVL